MTHHPDGSVPQPDRYAPPPHQEQPYTQDPSVADRVSAAAGAPGHEQGPPAPGGPAPGYAAPPPAAYGRPPAPAPGHDAPPAPSPELRQALAAVRSEVGKAVVGQDGAVTSLLIALLCKGHVLLEGVPGVAKTLLVRTLAASLDLGTKRVQFTPDLMPGDVTGSLVYDARTAEFSFREGPVFTNLLLADEINRTPPK
ncbi:MAG: family ATPase, partial [Cellulosimicrobium sp.]|nr:family ATPase [Cellulosimicrobium sp.]